MKFNKISRKVLAYACATAMVFSSVSAYQVLQVSAYEESDYTTLENEKNTTVGDWTLYAGKWGSNTGEMAYAGSKVDDLSLKIISSDGNLGSWKLQAKHTVTGLTKDTTYDLKLKFNSSKAGKLIYKVENPDVAKVGLEIKEGENEVALQFKATSESRVMALDLSGMPSGTVLDFGGITCTEATEIETTTAQQTDEEGYYSSSKSQWTTSLPWQVFTVGSMKYKGTATKNAVTADFKFLEAGGGDWNTQAKVPADKQVFGPLEASGDGVNYKVKVAYTSTATFGANLQVNGKDNNVTFEEGTHELNLDYVSKADYPTIFMNLGNAVANSQLTFTMTFTKDGETEPTETKPAETQPEVTEPTETKPAETQPEVTEPTETKPAETQPEVTEPTETKPAETKPEVTEPTETKPDVTEPSETETKPEVTEPAETETTTAAETTTTKKDETTTKSAETTTAKTATTTTVAPTTTAPATTVAPAKVTVKKVAIKKATKKKSAKKASIVLKKVSGVAGYQVKVSTSKKFAKKTTVTVNAKSVKVTVKKLKANKTYFVKARAYKKVSGSKVYGKWSKVIKIANK